MVEVTEGCEVESGAGYIIEFTFGGLGLIPAQRTAQVTQTAITWNYTTILNIIFLLFAAALLIRFFRTGAGPMLKMMGGDPAQPEHHTQPDHERTTPGHAQPVTPTAGHNSPPP